MSGSEETNVKSVTRNNFRSRRPIGYVTIEQDVDEETFQRLKYVDCRQEYVVRRHSPRSVGCQVNTYYDILSTRNFPSPPPSSPPPSPPSSRVKCDAGCQITTKCVIQLSKPPTPQPTLKKCDVGCQMTTNYVILLPPSPPSLPPPPPPPSPPPTKELIYCIDLRPYVEILRPDPDSDSDSSQDPDPIPQKNDDIVTVGGGWNTMDEYLERHDPVKKFVYQRRHLKNFDLPKKKKTFYGFKSIYKYPNYTCYKRYPHYTCYKRDYLYFKYKHDLETKRSSSTVHVNLM